MSQPSSFDLWAADATQASLNSPKVDFVLGLLRAKTLCQTFANLEFVAHLARCPGPSREPRVTPAFQDKRCELRGQLDDLLAELRPFRKLVPDDFFEAQISEHFMPAPPIRPYWSEGSVSNDYQLTFDRLQSIQGWVYWNFGVSLCSPPEEWFPTTELASLSVTEPHSPDSPVFARDGYVSRRRPDLSEGPWTGLNGHEPQANGHPE